jgi:hypothetical protein
MTVHPLTMTLGVRNHQYEVIMPSTKVCPGCKKNIKSDALNCECGFDFLADECPGCDKPISLEDEKCPHCGYNLAAGSPPKPTKQPKQPKPKADPKPPKAAGSGRTKVKEQVKEVSKARAAMPAGYRGVTHIPALGRFGQPPIDFPELHFKGDANDDEALKEWAENLRYAWANNVRDGSWLSNHAIGYLAGLEKPLTGKAGHIMQLLGGDDWK